MAFVASDERPSSLLRWLRVMVDPCTAPVDCRSGLSRSKICLLYLAHYTVSQLQINNIKIL